MNELVAEQATELRLKLQDKDKELKLKDKSVENTLILNFKGKQVVYLITVEEGIIKFGHTKDIEIRIEQHRGTIW